MVPEHCKGAKSWKAPTQSYFIKIMWHLNRDKELRGSNKKILQFVCLTLLKKELYLDGYPAALIRIVSSTPHARSC